MNTDRQPVRRRVIGFAGLSMASLALVLLGFVVAYQFVDPAPPDRIVLATGEEAGAYARFGEAFAAELGAAGVDVELRSSAGSVDNLELLLDSQVDVAFVQGGLGQTVPVGELLAIGSLYREPLFLFADEDAAIDGVGDLAGRRVAPGVEGSGTRAVVLELLAAHGVGSGDTELRSLQPAALAPALQNGEVDAAFVIAAPQSELVTGLSGVPGVRIQSLEHAAAYVRRFAYLSRVTLPEGVLDLAANRPDTDVTTVAATAMLVARRDLHPAIVDLLLVAAAGIHGGPGLLDDAGEFPTGRYVDIPLSPDARRHFEHGAPFLMRYLPFWAATLVDRLWIMLLPLLGLAIPLAKIVPPAYRWRMRRRLLRIYRDLESIDPKRQPIADAGDRRRRLEALAELDKLTVFASVPQDYKDDVYKLRRDIEFVRASIRSRTADQPESSGATSARNSSSASSQ